MPRRPKKPKAKPQAKGRTNTGLNIIKADRELSTHYTNKIPELRQKGIAGPKATGRAIASTKEYAKKQGISWKA